MFYICTMNCLTHLLKLWKEGHRFTIFYNGDHCFGINEKKVFDLNNTFKKDFLSGEGHRYLPIEKCHEKKVIKEIFNLTEKQKTILYEYFENIL